MLGRRLGDERWRTGTATNRSEIDSTEKLARRMATRGVRETCVSSSSFPPGARIRAFAPQGQLRTCGQEMSRRRGQAKAKAAQRRRVQRPVWAGAGSVDGWPTAVPLWPVLLPFGVSVGRLGSSVPRVGPFCPFPLPPPAWQSQGGRGIQADSSKGHEREAGHRGGGGRLRTCMEGRLRWRREPLFCASSPLLRLRSRESSCCSWEHCAHGTAHRSS
jgi:hypothetical protein